MKNLDVRARYTRQVIEEQFLALLREKPHTKITVTELCQGAHLNRATFYKHYQDVPDLLERTERQLLDDLRERIEGHTPGSLETLLLDVTSYMRQYGKKYMALGSEHGDPALAAKTFLVCYEWAYPLLTANLPQLDEGRRELLYQFLSHGSGGVLTAWLRGGMVQSSEEVANFLMETCTGAAHRI